MPYEVRSVEEAHAALLERGIRSLAGAPCRCGHRYDRTGPRTCPACGRINGVRHALNHLTEERAEALTAELRVAHSARPRTVPRVV